MSVFKRFFAVATAALTLFMSMPAEAAILEKTEEKTLVKGVTYTHIERLEKGGWQNIHVTKIDLSEPHLAFDILRNESGASFLENTLASATAADAVCAINADFFAAKKGQSGRGSAVGVEISDGKLITTPASDEKMNALYETAEGEFYFNEFKYDITLTAPNGNSDKIRHINKYDDLNEIVLYNRNWGEFSLGAHDSVIEIVVEDNVVTQKLRNSEPVEIPENGFILTENLEIHTFLDDNLNVGDEIEIEISTTPDFNNIKNAVSGGALLVVEGIAKTEFSHNIAGKNPRTAVGLDESGTIMYLVVVEGRKTTAAGMTQSELATFMAEIGCYNALNFDGGGSSLMAIKNEDGKIVAANTPSDNYKRPVTNSVGIISSAKKGAPKSISLKTDDNKMFKNTHRSVKISAYDSYFHKLDINLEDVTWSLSGVSGNVVDGMVFAKEAGTATVSASYKGIEASIEIEVLGTLATLSFNQTEYTLKSGESSIISLTGRDENGFSALVYARDTDIFAEGDAIEISGNLLTARKKGASVLTAGFGQSMAYSAVCVDGAEKPSVPDNKKPKDTSNVEGAELKDGGFTFSVFGNTREPDKMFDLFLMNTAVSAMDKKTDLHGFVGSSVNGELLDGLGENYFLANDYGKFTKGGSTFITINNTNGNIYSNDTSQWTKLFADARSADENLFVFLNKITISDNELELESFKNLMAECSKSGTNVYVFGGGWKNTVSLEDGVRYVTLAGVFPSIGLKPPATNISYVKYMLVTVNGSDVTYELCGILE